MKIIPLSEGAFTVDQSKQFVPFNLTNDNLQQRSAGSLLVEIQPFVVITSKDVLLIDTGLGFANADGTLQLHQNLISHDIDPSDITKVLMSHLHKDHAGGVSINDKILNQRFLSFPHATYYVQQQELSFALQKGTPSYIPDEINMLQQAGNVHFLEGDGVIDNYIRYEVTGAHSPWHQVFWIEENGETIFYGADDAPQLHQMKSRFVAKYDYDGKKCMELRQQWWEQGRQEKWTFLFYHDVKNPVWSFT
ncbi:MAG TPA: MBL fold metallo-hydrolase [Agriterribacter sp.]|uniref:MBL fold metallo-hydrolase n=1 Tax=Agriterribacter sp. TaxID=2821509 RepID=UPI002C2CDC06|nr:MBL fold metallo-hydrolase [Agriterribacter sp.]HRQ18215.1 MBL fold metallo-hydrolase [Agriterribacter sp.]